MQETLTVIVFPVVQALRLQRSTEMYLCTGTCMVKYVKKLFEHLLYFGEPFSKVNNARGCYEGPSSDHK